MLWQPMSWRLLAHSHMLGITSICLMFQSSKSCFALCQLMWFCFPAFNGWVYRSFVQKHLHKSQIALFAFFLSTIFINSMIIHIYSNIWCSFFITYTDSDLNLLSLTQTSQVIYDYKMKRFYKLKNEFTLPFINQTSSAIYEIKYK